MPSIKLQKVSFTTPPFRKLGDITIDFAPRITVIAGHNGIGKSTIMALVANTSGLSRSHEHKSLFGKAFQGNLFDIAHIDFEAEYRLPKEQGVPFPEPTIEYLINGTVSLIKVCSMTGRDTRREARVVPRTLGRTIFEPAEGVPKIGPDAKVPLPTIYLGMTRMFPVGEAGVASVQHTDDKLIASEEKQFISKFINDVVSGSKTTGENITSISIKGTKKLAKHPDYGFDTRCVSLGQDSLSSIATALASFQKLKRTWSDYPGGLFVIDEVDAGLHPHAQRKLVRALQKAARSLDLQIVATTHSTHVLEEVHPEGEGNEKAPDGVVYLMDTAKPKMAANFSLKQILDDMNLKAPGAVSKPKPPVLKVYFEDDEAALVFEKTVPKKFKTRLKKAYNLKLDPLPIGVGGSNLIGLSSHDPYFKTVLMVVDADTAITGKDKQNVVKLPGAKGQDGKGMSPERTLHAFITSLVDHPNDHKEAWTFLENVTPELTTNQLREHLLSGDRNMTKRESAKEWWKANLQHIKNWQLCEAWVEVNKPDVDVFLDALEQAIAGLAKSLK